MLQLQYYVLLLAMAPVDSRHMQKKAGEKNVAAAQVNYTVPGSGSYGLSARLDLTEVDLTLMQPKINHVQAISRMQPN